MVINRTSRGRYLCHHGIKGQKWGVRNGPPYPIKPGKKRRRSKPVYGSLKDLDYKDIAFTTYNLAAGLGGLYVGFMTADITTMVYGAAATVTAGSRFVKAAFGYSKDAIAENRLKKSSLEVDKKTGFHKKQEGAGDTSIAEDMTAVNPGYNNFSAATKNNCMLCTSTYDLRRRGFDVKANTSKVGFMDSAVNKWYPKAKIESSSRASIRSDLLKQGEGARGNLMFSWSSNPASGHSIAYEIRDGKVHLIDCQIGKEHNFLLMNRATNIRYARLDNVDFDPEAIKEVAH